MLTKKQTVPKAVTVHKSLVFVLEYHFVVGGKALLLCIFFFFLFLFWVEIFLGS